MPFAAISDCIILRSKPDMFKMCLKRGFCRHLYSNLFFVVL